MEYKDKIPFKSEFYPLYIATGWNERLKLNPDELELAIKNSFAVVSVYEGDELIGFGRVVSDGVAYATIYDVMVTPKWQHHGIGSQIIRILVNKCERQDIRRIHLFAAKDAEHLFKKLGFVARPVDSRGMVYEKTG
jgi:N-acetylglutamate synthase-like GNAT family acetyltransferase